ncbi:MAG TPA: CBS domain-containing protein [Terriglobales bacterium]|jgi:acetoin utilization protein AcuB|nr:CBS domain-containing protein [Terriglobales bacterium]
MSERRGKKSRQRTNYAAGDEMKKRSKMPVVGAVMTSFPYFVEIGDTASKMERMMDEHGIRHLPVQENGKVVGIVSERDLHHYVKRSSSEEEKNRVCARDIMVREPFIAPFRAPLNEVVFEMAKRRIGSVIVQRQGKLAGILSAIDVCRILGEYLEALFPSGTRGGNTAA